MDDYLNNMNVKTSEGNTICLGDLLGEEITERDSEGRITYRKKPNGYWFKQSYTEQGYVDIYENSRGKKQKYHYLGTALIEIEDLSEK